MVPWFVDQWVVVVLLMVDWGGAVVCGSVGDDWKVLGLGGGCIVDSGSMGGGFVVDGGLVGGCVADGGSVGGCVADGGSVGGDWKVFG